MPDKRRRGSSWYLPWRQKEKHHRDNYRTEERYNRPPVHRHQSRKWSFTELRDEDQSYPRNGGGRPDPIYPGYIGNGIINDSEDYKHDLKQKLRIWADWRTDVNDYRLRREKGGDSGGFFLQTTAPPPLSSLRNMGDTLPLMTYSVGENSATCMRPKEFLQMGIPRVRMAHQATLEDATRDLNRDIHNMHFRDQRVWRNRPVVNQGFAKR